MSIEAMKLALDCLEDIFGKDKIDVGAINALRQAIAEAERQESDDLTIAYMSGFYDGKNKDTPQPEQKPVAWGGDCVLGHCGSPAGCEDSNCCRANYTAPPERKPLTDEQLIAAYDSEQQGRYGDHIRSLRAIEAAHGIKGE